jgi:hypothetical protein
VGKMKKLIILFIFAWEILGYGTEQGDITYEVRAGIQVNIVLDNVHFLDMEAGKFFGLDVYKRVSGRLDLGLGAQYNTVESTKFEGTASEEAITITRMPIYAVAKLHLAQTFFLNPYFKILAGYQVMLDADVEGLENGSYYGAGIGIELGDFVLDYMYTAEENKGDSQYRGSVGHALALGYRF